MGVRTHITPRIIQLSQQVPAIVMNIGKGLKRYNIHHLHRHSKKNLALTNQPLTPLLTQNLHRNKMDIVLPQKKQNKNRILQKLHNITHHMTVTKIATHIRQNKDQKICFRSEKAHQKHNSPHGHFSNHTSQSNTQYGNTRSGTEKGCVDYPLNMRTPY